MANPTTQAPEATTPDRSATCGACGQSGARHIWGPEAASMAGAGCDGWQATADQTEGASAPSADAEGRCEVHTRRNCPTCFPEPEWTAEDFKAADRRFAELYREAQADTIRRSGWYAEAWDRKAVS